MKYKFLLTGKNDTVMDDFFALLADDVELMTTSVRYEDIMTHLKYFKPDAFCYCISNEPSETINRMTALKHRLEKAQIPLVVIGTEDDQKEFGKVAYRLADLTLNSSLKASGLEKSIVKYIKEQEAKRQEEEAQRQAEEQVKTTVGDTLNDEELAALVAAANNKQKHVLVVDDSSIMLKAIKEQLHGKYEVATAISGKVALKFLEKRSTDLILLDYEMPVENGPAVLTKLRENPETKDIPVIFLTGVTERSKIQQVLAMEPQGYLLKPVDHNKLMAALENILGGE